MNFLASMQSINIWHTGHGDMGHAVQKCVFKHMMTVKAKISLGILTVWSGPSLSANKIIGYDRMYGEQRHRWFFGHTQDDLNLHILRMFEATFSFDAAHMYMCRLYSGLSLSRSPRESLKHFDISVPHITD